ncbi:uncharacterized protein M6B38_269445 [Iris pallida]|uniref:Uncharacterized protein n=1 Tax=Iris pallida TaxID=29817 RepID=A0AAX6I7C6_IRIPA|nr:uncharacterized protein M6B38_269445 [Iris pallida]
MKEKAVYGGCFTDQGEARLVAMVEVDRPMASSPEMRQWWSRNDSTSAERLEALERDTDSRGGSYLGSVSCGGTCDLSP